MISYSLPSVYSRRRLVYTTELYQYIEIRIVWEETKFIFPKIRSLSRLLPPEVDPSSPNSRHSIHTAGFPQTALRQNLY